MNKQYLTVGTLLRYIGKPFEGLDPRSPQAKFLGYDSNGWTGIWIDYQGQIRFVSLSDVEVDHSIN